VVYKAEQDTINTKELYSVPIAGGTVNKLNGALVTGGDVGNPNLYTACTFQISGDSSRVVYCADQDTDNMWELYSVPIAGGIVTKLNNTMTPYGDIFEYGDKSIEISADSSRVVYCADQDTDGVLELYSVPIGGGTVGKLNTGGNVFHYPYYAGRIFQISADSSCVVYRADQDSAGVYELYSVPLAGGTVTRLNDTMVPGGNIGGDLFVGTFEVSADSSYVMYCADQDTDEVDELYHVPIEGGTVTKLNNTIVNGGSIRFFEISLDSSRMLYYASQDTYEVYELYATAIDNDGDAIADYDELNIYGTNPHGADSDEDGIDDGDELNYWGDDWNEDMDMDSLINLLDNDSDGDGFLDGEERDAGSDPSDPNSVPNASIPTVSEWGMLFLTILLIAVGMVLIRKRRTAYV